MIFCTRKIVKCAIGKEKFAYVRSLKNYSCEAFNDLIVHENWDNVLNCDDTNEAWENFGKTFTSIINKIAPRRHRKLKIRSEPWLTDEIIKCLHERDKYLRKYNKSKDITNRQEFCKYNLAQKLVKQAKKNYILNQTETHKNDSKKLWSLLKSLGYQQKTVTKEPLVLKINNVICYDPVVVANHVNDFFVNIAQNIVNALPSLVDSFSALSEHCKNFYRNLGVSPSMFKLQQVSSTFVKNQLNGLNPQKSTGLDTISPRFLKDGADNLTNIITHLINLSIRNKCVPTCVKKAKVTPLHKKGSKLEVGNYRPISILNAISKIIEKAVHLQVNNHCKKYNLYYPLQSGFRTSHSTDTCLIGFHDFIRSEIESGNYVGIVMIDVQKAFDSVNHNLLCQKIKLAGIEPDWFASYLCNRTQIVSMDNVTSSERIITCGVPQGSILGPWFYLMYCNDLPASLKCNTIMYADDTILIRSDKHLDTISNLLSEDLTKCYHWLTNNQLAMHKGKTEVMVLSSKRKRHNTNDFEIQIDEHKIKASKTAKYLGLKLDNTLSGDSIVSTIINKSMARLKFLYRHRESLDIRTRKQLSKSLILCHFDYATSAWYMPLNKRLKKSLQVLQNKIVRFILDLGPRCHIGQTELDKAGLLCVNDRARH
jgi:hypothetical protein